MVITLQLKVIFLVNGLYLAEKIVNGLSWIIIATTNIHNGNIKTFIS